MKVCPKCGKQYPDDANFCPLDAGRLVVDDQSNAQSPEEAAPPAPLPADGGRVVGSRFKLGDRIGGGLTGELYQAVDQDSGTSHAVKLVDPSVFPSSLLLQRTERELRQLARLDSAGIAKVHAHGRDSDTLWVATELVTDSRSLHDVVFDEGPMELGRASRIVLAIGQALADAAKVGVIHRDLAPKNVLLGPGDRVKIINFGVAVPTTEKVPGVAEFVAPEMVEGKPVDQRANIYSLGALFYHLLTGRPPYMGEPDEVYEQHLGGTPEPPSEHVELPDVVDAVVLKALERLSSKRFMTLRQFLSAVEHLAQGNLDMLPAVSQSMARAGKGKEKKRQLSSTMLGYGGKTGETAAITGASTAADAAAQAEPDAGATQKLGSGAAPVASPAPAGVPAASAETQVMGSLSPQTSPAAATTPMAQEASPAAADPLPPQTVVAPQQPAFAPQQPAFAPQHPATAMQQLAPAAEGSVAERGADAGKFTGAPAVEQDTPAAPAPAIAPVAREAAPARQGEPVVETTKRRKDKKGQFRETLWFKKGEMDSAAAAGGEKKQAQGGDDVPVEDRYEDDGSLTSGDREKFSLKTGGTESMPAFRNTPAGEGVSSKELIEEMKGGRGKIIALIVIGVLALIGIIAFAVASGGDEAKKEPGSEEGGAAPEAPAPAPE